MAPPEKETSPVKSPGEKPDPRYIAEWKEIKDIDSFAEILKRLRRVLQDPPPSALLREYVMPTLTTFKKLYEEELQKNSGKVSKEHMEAFNEVIARLPLLMERCDMIHAGVLDRLRTREDCLNVVCGLLAMYPKHAETFGVLKAQEKKTEPIIVQEMARGRALVALLADPSVAALTLREMTQIYVIREHTLKFFAGEKREDVRIAKADALCFLAHVLKEEQGYLKLRTSAESTMVHMFFFLQQKAPDLMETCKKNLFPRCDIGKLSLMQMNLYTDPRRAGRFCLERNIEDEEVAKTLCVLAQTVQKTQQEYLAQRESQAPTVADILPEISDQARCAYKKVIALSHTDPAEISARLRMVDTMADEGKSGRFWDDLGLMTEQDRTTFDIFRGRCTKDDTLSSLPEPSGVSSEHTAICHRALKNIHTLIVTGDGKNPPWSTYLSRLVGDGTHNVTKDLNTTVQKVLKNLSVKRAWDLYILMQGAYDEEGELPESPEEIPEEKLIELLSFLCEVVGESEQTVDPGSAGPGATLRRLFSDKLKDATQISEGAATHAAFVKEFRVNIESKYPTDIINPTERRVSVWEWVEFLASMYGYGRLHRILSGGYSRGVLRALAGEGGHVSGGLGLRHLEPETVRALQSDPVAQRAIRSALAAYDASGGVWGPRGYYAHTSAAVSRVLPSFLVPGHGNITEWAKGEQDLVDLGKQVRNTLKAVRAMELHNSGSSTRIPHNPGYLLHYGLRHDIQFHWGVWDGRPRVVERVGHKRRKITLGKKYLDSLAREVTTDLQRDGLVAEAKAMGYEMEFRPDGIWRITATPERVQGWRARADTIAERARALRGADFQRRARSVATRLRRIRPGTVEERRQTSLRQEGLRLRHMANADGFELQFQSDYFDFDFHDTKPPPQNPHPAQNFCELRSAWRELFREARESNYNVATYRDVFNVPISQEGLAHFRAAGENIAMRVRIAQWRGLVNSMTRRIPVLERLSRTYYGDTAFLRVAENDLINEASRRGFTLRLRRANGTYAWELSSPETPEVTTKDSVSKYWTDLEEAYGKESLRTLKVESAELAANAKQYGCKLTVDMERGTYKLGGPILSDPLSFHRSVLNLQRQMDAVIRLPQGTERENRIQELGDEARVLEEHGRSMFNLKEEGLQALRESLYAPRAPVNGGDAAARSVAREISLTRAIARGYLEKEGYVGEDLQRHMEDFGRSMETRGTKPVGECLREWTERVRARGRVRK